MAVDGYRRKTRPGMTPGLDIPGRVALEDQEKAVIPGRETDGLIRGKGLGNSKYHSSFPDLCYELLSNSNAAKTKSHCCAMMDITRHTLYKWMKMYPELGDAITRGLEAGAAKWRDKVRMHAFKPSSEVNNGLIKLISSNVYGIKEEKDINVREVDNHEWHVTVVDPALITDNEDDGK